MYDLRGSVEKADLAAATRTLEGLRQGLNCDNILSQARATQGVIGADLGESDVANLAPQFQQFARTGEIGSVSTPIRTPPRPPRAPVPAVRPHRRDRLGLHADPPPAGPAPGRRLRSPGRGPRGSEPSTGRGSSAFPEPGRARAPLSARPA